jgi:hypothetical protein
MREFNVDICAKLWSLAADRRLNRKARSDLRSSKGAPGGPTVLKLQNIAWHAAISPAVSAERTAAPEHAEANTRDMAWVLADGTKHMIQLNGSNQKRWPTAPARHGAAVPESISAYTEFNSARRIRLRVTPEIKPRAFFKPSIIRGYDVEYT